MPKNLFQDMVKVKRMNQQKRFVSQRFERRDEDEIGEEEKPLQPVNIEKNIEKLEYEEERPKYKIWIVAVIAVMFLLFAISYLFLSATITVNPKVQSKTLNENLSADKNTTGDTLPFDLVAISGEESRTIQTTGEKDVEQNAKGTVVIYNNFSTAVQGLDINTRLEGSNGKIYKTVKQIMVPGIKGTTPGSVEVDIYASIAGADYNSGPLDFTIFGFKGTPKYTKFYARSKGDITGGIKGKASSVSDVDKVKTLDDLKTALQAKLFQKALEQTPKGFVLFKNATFLDSDNSNIDSAVPATDNTVSVIMKGTLYGFLFNEDKLTAKIASDVIPDYDGTNPVYISNIKDLDFSLTNNDSVSFKDASTINFTLSGDAKIVSKVDEEKLKNDLLGKSKSDFSQILLQYPNIETAQMVITPFWRRSMPDKVEDIKVIVNYPK